MADSVTQTIPTPPPGTNFLATISTSLTFIMVATPFGAMLVPVLILLFFFSTAASRRAPVFYLNVIACLLGLLVAFMNGALEVRQLLHPEDQIPQSLFLSTIAITLITPMIVDSVLLTRVIAFYPKRTSTRTDRLRALLFPVVVKIARFIVVVLYLHDFATRSKDVGSVILIGATTWFRNPYIIAEWTLQVVDNSYSSLFLLYKLRLFDVNGRAGWIVRHPTTLKRIRGLFYIALGNFIFPVILNVAQIIFITSDRSFLHGTYVLFVNDYVSILGVVFATIWTTGSHWSREKFGSTGSTWNQEEPKESYAPEGVELHAVRLPSRNAASDVESNTSWLQNELESSGDTLNSNRNKIYMSKGQSGEI